MHCTAARCNSHSQGLWQRLGLGCEASLPGAIPMQAQQAASISSLLVACACVHLHFPVVRLAKLLDWVHVAAASGVVPASTASGVMPASTASLYRHFSRLVQG